MSNVEKIIQFCVQVSSQEGLLNSADVNWDSKENCYKLNGHDSITYKKDGGFTFTHLEKLSDYGDTYTGDKNNWVLEYNNGEISIQYDYFYLDDEGQFGVKQTLTLENGKGTMQIFKVEESSISKDEDEMIYGIWRLIHHALNPFQLEQFKDQPFYRSKKIELHTFFKNTPAFEPLIDNVIAPYF